MCKRFVQNRGTTFFGSLFKVVENCEKWHKSNDNDGNDDDDEKEDFYASLKSFIMWTELRLLQQSASQPTVYCFWKNFHSYGVWESFEISLVSKKFVTQWNYEIRPWLSNCLYIYDEILFMHKRSVCYWYFLMEHCNEPWCYLFQC